MKKHSVQCELIYVTPEMAAEWLANKWGEQRNVRNTQVERLASDMIAGRFGISPDAILRIKGKLANGQHRLEAVVRSGKGQWFLVMDSNDEELYKVIDCGLRRTAADGLIGVLYAKAIPSIARWVIGYNQGTISTATHSAARASAGWNGQYLSQVEIIDYCQENLESLTAAASFVAPLYDDTKLLPVSIGGALFIIGHASNKGEEVKSFLLCVYLDGGANAAGDLRNRLIANRGGRSKLLAGYVFGLSLKALKSFCNGTRPGVLRFGDDEMFPVL